MIDKKEFAKIFEGYEMPFELEKLLEFQNKIGSDFYSEGFELTAEGQDAVSPWSVSQGFLSKLMPFAQANGSGSCYAIWDNGKTTKTNEMPIVIFGDEGGEHVVAENLLQLFQILTFDAEPMVDFDEVYFYKDKKSYEPSEELEAYKKWLKQNFDLESIDDAQKLVKKAQKKYQKSFLEWTGKYINRE